MKRTVRHRPQLCPGCGAVLDAATPVGTVSASSTPDQDDWSVCCHCALTLRFSPSFEVRAATAEELSTLGAADPDGLALLARMKRSVIEMGLGPLPAAGRA